MSHLYAGPGYGSTWVPEVDGEVLVLFAHGDMRWPFVIGCLYSPVDQPPESRSDSSDVRTLLTPNGSEIRFDETNQVVTLKTKSGASVELDEQSGELTLEATSKITLEGRRHLDRGLRIRDGQGIDHRSQLTQTTQRREGTDMGAPAARLNDSVLGADTHIVMVPSRHRHCPHSDPRSRVLGHVDVRRVTGRPHRGSRGGRRRNGGHEQPAARANAPRTSFQSPPSNRGKVSQGSSTVTINGKAAARVGDSVRTCNDPTDLDTSAIVSGAAAVTIG